jgi:hypothetical protein
MTMSLSPVRSSRARVGTAALAALAVALVTLTTALAPPVGAQSAPSTPTSTVAPENPGSTAAGVVFFGVCAVVIVGALVLYLRNRKPKVSASER